MLVTKEERGNVSCEFASFFRTHTLCVRGTCLYYLFVCMSSHNIERMQTLTERQFRGRTTTQRGRAVLPLKQTSPLRTNELSELHQFTRMHCAKNEINTMHQPQTLTIHTPFHKHTHPHTHAHTVTFAHSTKPHHIPPL